MPIINSFIITDVESAYYSHVNTFSNHPFRRYILCWSHPCSWVPRTLHLIMGACLTIERKAKDRISKLQNDVLCHILLFLNISSKQCGPWFHCSTLSSWIQPWNSSRASIYYWIHVEEKITRFSFKCNNDLCCSCYVDVDKWVSVVARKVEHVNRTSMLFCVNLFTCTTIVTLKLKGLSDLLIPCDCDVRLLNLKSFHVQLCGDAFLLLLW